jgi:hypothetical protein
LMIYLCLNGGRGREGKGKKRERDRNHCVLGVFPRGSTCFTGCAVSPSC